MKLIKQGDPNKANGGVEFECDQCGCIFVADRTEWKYAPQMAQQRGEGTYICKCPCCGKEVWK